jgi:predicted permease
VELKSPRCGSRVWFWLGRPAQDLRYAWRQLGRAPGFALTVVLTLVLGIGANLAVFQLLYGAVFARLPVARPNQLYSLHAVKSPFDAQWIFSSPAYRRLRNATANSAAVVARSGISDGIFQASGGSSERASYQMVSTDFFDVLGVSPAAGRSFLSTDDRPGPNPWPAILRYGYWMEALGGDRSAVGKQGVVNGVPVVIVGIAAERFSGVVAGRAPDIWLPLEAQDTGRLNSWFDSLGPGSGADIRASHRNQSSVFWLWVLADVPEQAKSSAVAQWTEVLQPDLELLATASRDGHDREQILRSRVQIVSAATGEGAFRDEYAQPLIILMGMAGLVLLVGCVNLANLQMARLLSRQHELAVRTALGASRWRLLRQLMAENLLLTLVGGTLALVVGRVCSSLVLHWASGSGSAIPLDLHMGWRLFLFAAAVMLAAVAAFGVLPAWWITRGVLAGEMKSRAGASSLQGSGARKWSNALLAGQVSFSLVLVSVAGLFAQSLLNVTRVDAGLDREHVISVHLDYINSDVPEEQQSAWNERIVARLKELPAVKDAAASQCAIPGCIWNTAIHVSGHPGIPERQMHGEENHVGAGYFHTLGIPILQGRDFDERDRPDTQKVAILNHAFARTLFGDESPLGHRVGYQAPPHDADFLIVGEVGDARVDDLRSASPPVVYFPVNQRPALAGTIEVRASGNLTPLYGAIRQALLSVNPNLPISEIVPLRAEYDTGLSREILLARLTGVFGSLALALAGLGFYGLLSFNVTRRRLEIGIRMAVGATAGDVTTLFLRQTLGILVAGIVPGVLLTEAVGAMVESLLYGAGKFNLVPLLIAISVLVAMGVAAALRPAWRAARIDPVEALRAE